MFKKDLRITGKHGLMTKSLVKDGVFDRNIDVYMCGAAIGLKYNLKAEKDKGSDGTNILMGAFQTEYDNCMFLYQLTMLLSDTDKLNIEERINRAFMFNYEEETEEVYENIELFNSYVRGGIEKLHSLYTHNVKTKDELLEEMYKVLQRYHIVMNSDENEMQDSILENYSSY